MNAAIGIGRPIMQYEFGRILACLTNLGIEIDILPLRQLFRFIVRQIAAHRKIGFRQENGWPIIEGVLCLFVVAHYMLHSFIQRPRIICKSIAFVSGEI